MLNRVVLIGRLTRDPELKYLPNGNPVASFTLAVERQFSKTKEADFIRIKVWQKLAEICANNLQKGRLVACEGRLEVRSYDAQDGSKRTVTGVVADNVRFLDFPKDKQDCGEYPVSDEFTLPDEELPF